MSKPIRRKRLLRVPRKGPEVVKKLYHLINSSELTPREVLELAGFDRSLLYRWRNGNHNPSLDSIEACFNVLGYELWPRKIKKE